MHLVVKELQVEGLPLVPVLILVCVQVQLVVKEATASRRAPARARRRPPARRARAGCYNMGLELACAVPRDRAGTCQVGTAHGKARS